MSSTNKTTHYDLSQYVGTDKPTYLSDYNSDMAKIDAALYQANTNASSAESNASTALTQAGQALSKANTNEGDIDDLESLTDLLNTNVTTLNSFMNNVTGATISEGNLTVIDKSGKITWNQQNLKYKLYEIYGLKLCSIYGDVYATPSSGATGADFQNNEIQGLPPYITNSRTIFNVGHIRLPINTTPSYEMNFYRIENGVIIPSFSSSTSLQPLSTRVTAQCCILG